MDLYTYRKGLILTEVKNLPWYQDYRYHIVLLLLIIGFLIIVFW